MGVDMSWSWLNGAMLLLAGACVGWLWYQQKRLKGSAQHGQGKLRLVSSLHLGPQHRVVVVAWDGAESQAQWVLGVTPQHISLVQSLNGGLPDHAAGAAVAPDTLGGVSRPVTQELA